MAGTEEVATETPKSPQGGQKKLRLAAFGVSGLRGIKGLLNELLRADVRKVKTM